MYLAVADYKYSNYKISHSGTELIRDSNYITSSNQRNVRNNINFFILDIILSSIMVYSYSLYPQFNLIFLLEYIFFHLMSIPQRYEKTAYLLCLH